jgi:hypothetical protein
VSTAILFLVLFQAGRMHRSQMDASRTVNVRDVAEQSPDLADVYEEQQLIQRLNGLTRALTAFTDDYRSGKIDLKKVKALRKAMQDLEKSGWFKSPQPN